MKKQFMSEAAHRARRFRQSKSTPIGFGRSQGKYVFVAAALLFCFSLLVPLPLTERAGFLPQAVSPVRQASASSVYHDFSTGPLGYTVNASTVNWISQNDNWANVPSFEGYSGANLTSTEGVDPQTVLGTEFPNNALPVAGQTQVNANKNNPDAYNTGGVTEFDTGTYLALGIQGTGNAESPYVVMYLNTVGRTNITISYNVIDIDAGRNSAVMPVALQYRVGETGLFTNIPAAFIADATDGPALAGRVTPVSVILPPSCNNQPRVQVRIMTNNPVGQGEWVGINNLLASAFVPTAAHASISGRVFAPEGSPLSRATVNLYNSVGGIQTTQTNSFGYYSFNELPAGEIYVLEARSKRYVFSNPTQVVTLNDNLTDVNFYAGGGEPISIFSSLRKK